MDKRQKLVLVIAILASFVPFLDGSIVNVALPAMSNEVGGGLVTEQWVLDGYLLSLSALILVAGSFSDLFGRSRVLASGLLLFGVASVLCALAPTSGFLIAARVLQGVGGALLVPSSLAIITANFDGALRARAIGVWTGWTGVAFIAGPVFGGTLVEFFGWRWIFGINVVPIALTLLLLARLGDRAVPSPTKPRIDVVGAVLGSVGLAAPVFALIEHQRLGWDDPAVLVALIGGVIVFGGFLVWERRTANPMLPLALFSVRNFAVGNIATAFVYASISLTPLAVTLFLQRVVGATPLQAGLASLPQAIIPLLLSGTFGTLAGRYGPRWFMAAGPAVAGLGALWLLLTREPFDFWTQMLPGLLLLGLGLTMTVAPLTAAVLGAVSSAQSGIASAVNNAVSRVAGLIAVAFLGALVGGTLDFDGFHRVAVTGTVLLFIAAAVSAVGISNRARPVAVHTD